MASCNSWQYLVTILAKNFPRSWQDLAKILLRYPWRVDPGDEIEKLQKLQSDKSHTNKSSKIWIQFVCHRYIRYINGNFIVQIEKMRNFGKNQSQNPHSFTRNRRQFEFNLTTIRL